MNADNTEKLLTLSEINELKDIAENHCINSKFNEAIKVTLKIIDIAEKAHLYSIAREQGVFVAEIYKKIQDKNKLKLIKNEFENLKEIHSNLLEANKIIEAHKHINDFKEKFEIYELNSIEEVKQFLQKDENNWINYRKSEYNLKSQLEPLEIQFNSYLKTNNLLLAGETLEKAKILLKGLGDIELLKSWKTSEEKFIRLKTSVEVEESLHKVSELTDNYDFKTANSILDIALGKVISNKLNDLKQKIEAKKKYIIDAETKYNKLEKDIADLEILVKKNVSENDFQQAIDNINQIIKISRFIGKTQFLEDYSQYVEKIEEKIHNIKKEDETKSIIKNLNFEGIEAVSKEEYLLATEKYEEIIRLLRKRMQ